MKGLRKLATLVVILMLAAAPALILSGCKQEEPTPQEQGEDMMDEAEDAADEMADEAGDAVEDAGDKAEDMLE